MRMLRAIPPALSAISFHVNCCFMSPDPCFPKGVAGGLHDVVRNEPLRKAASPPTAIRHTKAAATARDLLRRCRDTTEPKAWRDCQFTGNPKGETTERSESKRCLLL